VVWPMVGAVRLCRAFLMACHKFSLTTDDSAVGLHPLGYARMGGQYPTKDEDRYTFNQGVNTLHPSPLPEPA
jgi:hypothetical protein